MKKPNIIFILIDDMGWRDLSCYGSEFYETPNLDKLALEGMTFSDDEINITFGRQFSGGNILDAGGGGRFFSEENQKMTDAFFRPFHLNSHVAGGIAYPAV